MDFCHRLPPPSLQMLLILIICSSRSVEPANRCPNCGKTPVPYPFSTSSTCGDQSYKIRCATDTLLFDTINSSYPITSIDQKDQRFIIRPANFSQNTCMTTDFHSEGVNLNTTLPFNITTDNTIFYLNCSQRLLLSPLNCSAESLCHAYINATPSAAACGEAPICCTFKTGGSSTAYSIRIRETGCRAYRSIVDIDPSRPVSKWGEEGVKIQWAPPLEPVCRSQGDCDEGRCLAETGMVGISRCYCNSGMHWDSINGICAKDLKCPNPEDCNSSTNRTPLIAGLTSGLGVGLLACILTFLVFKHHLHLKQARDRVAREREGILNAGGAKSAKIFTGKQVKKASNNFSKDRLLGAGGYGEVYKGILEDGTVVALKCAKVGNTKSTDQVLNEVRILCQVNHRSLVRLLGCCVELEQPLLVYEFIPNGTLLEHLHWSRPGGRSRLTWDQRLRIARDTADGLAYLHSSAVPPIYHRDVKSSNILLDGEINAKVADFGLSRLAEAGLSHISTCAQGTLGYLDPEYYRNYQLTEKSDVYSFGVVLLEMVTAQKAIDFKREADDVNLAIYVQNMVKEERLMEVVDPALFTDGSTDLKVDTIKALGFLAMSCLEEKRQNRPYMKEVVEEIEYIMTVVAATAHKV